MQRDGDQPCVGAVAGERLAQALEIVVRRLPDVERMDAEREGDLLV